MPETESKQDEPKPVAPVETPEEKKQAAEEKKQADEAQRQAAADAKKQAEQDEKDIETFLSAVRGERAARGDGGSFDLDAFIANREAERQAEREADEKD
jgi:hypothetical protein